MRIMLCYDGSEESKEALKEARKHARAFSAEMLIVTSFAAEDRFHAKDIEAARSGLEVARASLAADGIPCETLISVRGLEPGEDLTLLAREKSVDEVVIGVKHRSRVGKLLIGSVAQHVILMAECPVLGVKKKL